MDFLRLSTTTFEDPKIKLLRARVGRDGYFVYIHILYLIAQGLTSKNTSCELPFAADTLSFDLGIERAEIIKILSFCIELDLIKGEADGTISCKKILTRLGKNKLSPAMRKIVYETEEPENYDPETSGPEPYHSNFFNSEENEITSENLQSFTKQVYEVWENSKLPCKKGGLMSFLSSDIKNSLSSIRRQNLSTDEVLQAVKNYAEVINDPNAWYTARIPFENFVKPSTIKRFLPDYFQKENFMTTNKSSAVENSKADELKGEIEF